VQDNFKPVKLFAKLKHPQVMSNHDHPFNQATNLTLESTTINRLKFGVTPNSFWPPPISLFTTKLELLLFIFKTDLVN
jgi:hypothetical protein